MIFHTINDEHGCRHCNFGIQIDPYDSECSFNCLYCWAKDSKDLQQRANKLSVDEFAISFEAFFKGQKKSFLTPILKRRIPIRLGYMRDPLPTFESKQKLTLKLIKLFNRYNYPFIIVTKSDLIATDEYLDELQPPNSSVQISLASTNEDLLKMIEPGAPSAKLRLEALSKLVQRGIWSTVRINPIIPHKAPKMFDEDNTVAFPFFDFNLIEQIAKTGVTNVVAGFGHFSKRAIIEISNKTNFNLIDFFNEETGRLTYPQEEIELYYKKIEELCSSHNINLSTCYLGSSRCSSINSDCCNTVSHIGADLDSTSLTLFDHVRLNNPTANTFEIFGTVVSKKLLSLMLKGLGK